MKLTKERCLKAVSRLRSLCKGIKNDYPLVEREKEEKFFTLDIDSDYGILKLVNEDKDVLEQLINEHFDNNMTTTWHNLVNEVDKLDSEIALLKRENKALAEDNEMKCEKISKLNKRIERLLEGGRIMSDAVDELTEEKERLEKMLETFK